MVYYFRAIKNSKMHLDVISEMDMKRFFMINVHMYFYFCVYVHDDTNQNIFAETIHLVFQQLRPFNLLDSYIFVISSGILQM